MGTRILSQMGWISSIQAFDGTDLSPRGSLAQNAFKLAYDPAATDGLFLLRDYTLPADLQNKVGALNASTGALRGIATGYRPFEVAINSTTNRAYVTDEQTSEILVIDGTSDAVVSRIPVLPTFGADQLLSPVGRHVAISERLNRIYLPRTTEAFSPQTYTSYLDVFDGGTNQFRGSITLDPAIGYYSNVVALDDTRRRIYVVATHQVGTYQYEATLAVYDADTEARIATVSLGSSEDSSIGLAANPVTGRVYASTGVGINGGGIAIVDGNTNVKIATVDSVRGEIAVNRRTNKVYVVQTRYDDNSVDVINGATDSLETSFVVPPDNGDFISALGVDEVTNRVYLAHGRTLGGRVTAYDANNDNQLVGQIDLGPRPAAGMAFAGASRQLFVSHDLDGVISVFQDATPAPADRFGNISTRAHVATGDDVLIGGFILDGTPSDTKRLMIRAIGPSLTQFGVAGALPDTTLEVHVGATAVTSNDNWKVSDLTGMSQQAEIEATGIAPSSDLESALVLSLPGGQSVTAIVRGKDGAAGVGLVEVYDLDLGLPVKLVNISTRGHVDSGDNVMIAGVIIVGSKPVQVVLRAIGPSLAGSGVPNPLEDPVLELRDPNGGLVASNDNWQEHEAEVNAALLAPTDPRESAIVANLYPANYTAIARGKDGATGIALVEAYYSSSNP
jgi:DNA-binding beta-propeller fold protein YncE